MATSPEENDGNNAFVTQASKTSAEIDEAIRKRKLSSDGDSKEERKVAVGEVDIKEHNMSIEECLNQFSVTIRDGLSNEQARDALAEYGPNTLTPADTEHPCMLLFHEMTGFFSLLLWLAGGLCFLGYALDNSVPDNLYLGIVLASVTLMTGLFSFYQEYESAAIMAGFKDFLPREAVVVRGGKSISIDAETLVPGDIVKLKAGDSLPADLRILEASDFKVDNSSLTGESEAQTRNTENLHENPMEATNLAFFGTNCAKGKATGLVIKTGDDTLIGSITGLMTSTENKKTPIAIEIEHFIHVVSGVAVFLGVTFLIIGFVKKEEPVTNLVFMIGIIVANVPEGLLATVTVSLTLTAKRMATKNVLVKNLEAVETLGSTTVIASDKTGTLTQNRMTAVELYLDATTYSVATPKERSDVQKTPTFNKALMVMGLCNNAVFDASAKNLALDVQQRKTQGDASESALLKLVEHVQNDGFSCNVEKFRLQHPKIGEIPFNSTNKYQVSVHLPNNNTEVDRLLVMKGAPERIWTKCSKICIEGKIVSLEDEHKASFDANINEMMFKGERVLGLCYAELDADEYEVPPCVDGIYQDTDTYDASKEHLFGREAYDPKSGVEPTKSDIQLVFCGLIALIDPPRVTVPKSVLSCQKAGIKVVMVTGDHPETAESIARKVNIIRGKTQRDVARLRNVPLKDIDPTTCEEVEAIVITGKELSTLTDQQLDNYLDYDQIVFARTSPAQKLKIVEGLQKKKYIRRNLAVPKQVKHVVAVTGDGVNDSPALKAADIGIAMGIAGTSVAKDAADMILLDDNFASIVNGVEEGRLIFDNLKKSIAYTLSSNIPEISPFLIFILVQVPLPLPTILILCIDLGTDMVPAISLAYEGREANIMSKPPRDARTDRLVTAKLVCFSYLQVGVIQAAAGFFSWVVVLKDFGFLASTMPGSYWAYEKDSFSCFVDPSTGSYDYSATIPRTVVCGSGLSANATDATGYLGAGYPIGYRSTDLAEDSTYQAGVWGNNGAGVVKDGFDFWAKSTKLADKYGDWSYVGKTGACNVSPNALDNVCWFPAEALQYAQTAYFISIIVVQWSDILACKTRTLSLQNQGMRNNMLSFGLFFETTLGALLCYVPAFNVAFSTRPIYFVHWLCPLPFAIFILSYDEIRKVLMRNLTEDIKFTGSFPFVDWYKKPSEGEQPNNWVYRNTYY